MTDRLLSDLEAMIAAQDAALSRADAARRDALALHMADAFATATPMVSPRADDLSVVAAHLDLGLSQTERQELLSELSSSPDALAELESAAALLQAVQQSPRRAPADVVEQAQALFAVDQVKKTVTPWWRLAWLRSPRAMMGVGLVAATVFVVVVGSGSGLLGHAARGVSTPGVQVPQPSVVAEQGREVPIGAPPAPSANAGGAQTTEALVGEGPSASTNTNAKATLALNPSAGPPGWAAIAFSASTRYAGVAGDARSQSDAEEVALANCRSLGAQDCAVQVSRQGRCLSLAAPANGAPSPGSQTAVEAAKNEALKACSRHAPGACQTVASVCGNG